MVPPEGGGTVYPNGTTPDDSPPPPPEDKNFFHRLVDKIRGSEPEKAHTSDEIVAKDPSALGRELAQAGWDDLSDQARRDLLNRMHRENYLYQCASVPVEPSAGYPGPQKGRLSDATDLGFRIVIDDSVYGVFGDSFRRPQQLPGKKSPDGKPYIRLNGSQGHRSFIIRQIDPQGNVVGGEVALSGDVPRGRYLPGGTIDDGDPHSELVMLTPVEGLDAGTNPGVLYRVTKNKNGGLYLRKVNKQPLPKNASAISGYKTTTPDGKPIYYFVTTTFQNDKQQGLVSWRARDINNPDTWEWYDADNDSWIKYSPDLKPRFIPGTGPMHGETESRSIREPYYRQLPDGTIVLAYLEGNQIKVRVSHGLPPVFQPVVSGAAGVGMSMLPKEGQQLFADPKVQDFLRVSAGAEALAWMPEITLHIFDHSGNRVNQPYGPIIEPHSASILNLAMTISQWTNNSDRPSMERSYRYGTYPLTLGPPTDASGATCKLAAQRANTTQQGI